MALYFISFLSISSSSSSLYGGGFLSGGSARDHSHIARREQLVLPPAPVGGAREVLLAFVFRTLPGDAWVVIRILNLAAVLDLSILAAGLDVSAELVDVSILPEHGIGVLALDLQLLGDISVVLVMALPCVRCLHVRVIAKGESRADLLISVLVAVPETLHLATFL